MVEGHQQHSGGQKGRPEGCRELRGEGSSPEPQSCSRRGPCPALQVSPQPSQDRAGLQPWETPMQSLPRQVSSLALTQGCP